MKSHVHPLISPALGTQRNLLSLHYGASEERLPRRAPKVYLQASLHADELPGMLVLHYLRHMLDEAEAANAIVGEIVVVPVANPIGLDQTLMFYQAGRFELASMENFNRFYPDFYTQLYPTIFEKLNNDEAHNLQAIRQAMLASLAEQEPTNELQSLRQTLMRLAVTADVVLDLHCDFEAVMHLYVEEPYLSSIEPLASYLGAQAVLYSKNAGAVISFDEALSAPWWKLREQARAEGRTCPIPLGCMSTTVELRGQLDVDAHSARSDAQAIFHYLQSLGTIAADLPSAFAPLPSLPAPKFVATPLAGTDCLLAPHSGVIEFHKQVGDYIDAGETVAHIIDPLSGRVSAVKSRAKGCFYARINLRFATTGLEIGRVSGMIPIRSGNLLSP